MEEILLSRAPVILEIKEQQNKKMPLKGSVQDLEAR